MKLLILSDIHGISKNIEILENKLVLKDFNYIILLGDIFRSYYATEKDREKILKFINRYKSKLIVVKGNCDSYDDLLEIPVPVDDVSYLFIDNIYFYFTHGNKYNYYNNDTFSNGVLIYGHEHIPYIKEANDMLYVNVGSLSLPRSDDGKTFAVYENKTIKIYNLEKQKEIYSCCLDKFDL